MRYGAIYGPNNILPVMWSVVKRLLDGRTRIVVNPTSRLPRANECFGRNAAEYFLLAVDNPGSQGEAFNGLEDTMPTTVQWIHMVAEAMGKEVEVVEMPTEIAAPYRPLDQGWGDGLMSPQIFTNEKARLLLGYKDVVGKRDAIATTARWMIDNQEKVMTSAGTALQEPFDYENEDKLLAAWDARDYHACLAIEWEVEPGWGHFYCAHHDPLSSCLCFSRTDEACVQMVKRRTLGTSLVGTWRRSTRAPTTGTRRSVWSRMAKRLRSFEKCAQNARSAMSCCPRGSVRLGQRGVHVLSRVDAALQPRDRAVVPPGALFFRRHGPARRVDCHVVPALDQAGDDEGAGDARAADDQRRRHVAPAGG